VSNCTVGDLNPGNSTTVDLVDVKVNGSVRNDATVSVTVKDSNNNVVAGGNAVAMPNIADGEYRGILPANLAIATPGRYLIEITATIAGVGVGFWQLDKVAKKRR
jgi:hypothetical protein